MTATSKALATASDVGGLGDFSAESLLETVKKEGAAKGTAAFSEVREAMGNVKPQLEVVVVQGHGTNSFKMGDGSMVPGVDGLTGVVVAYTRHNSFFDTEYGTTEKGTLPPCFSNDGATIAPNADDPQSERGCGTCKRNRDATDREAKEHAFEAAKTQTKAAPQVCTNYISLAFALPGRDVPVRVRFTAQAFKEWARYCQDIGTVRGRFLPHEVLTKITLENKKGAFGEFSVPHFEFLGALPAEVADVFTAQRESYTGLLRRDAENEGRTQDASSEAKAATAGSKADAKKAAGKAGKSAAL